MVMDEDTDIVAVTLRIAHFYHHESADNALHVVREPAGWKRF